MAISTLVSWNVFGCFIPHEGELEQNTETHKIVISKSMCRVFFLPMHLSHIQECRDFESVVLFTYLNS